MIRRHRDILSSIFNAEGFINGSMLAKICGVSIRTIQLDIKAINSMLKAYDIKISSEVIKGYYLDVESKEILKEKNIIRKVIDNEYVSEAPSTPFERQMYIMNDGTRLSINENNYNHRMIYEFHEFIRSSD